MFTSSECRTHAEQKIAQAQLEPRHQRRLLTAAQGWLVLAGQVRRMEKALAGAGKKRSKIGLD
jgi:hypothetical protein